ncbi:MAG: DUF4468 domain-containing protein [Bacteroidota bacterium]
MKNLFLVLAMMLAGKFALAQKELVTLDEHNKYIFYQVADMPGVTADTLYNRTMGGLKTNKLFKGIKPVVTAGSSITLKSKFTLYSSLTVAKHEVGDISYTLVTEFKDGKYRYWLTDFVFMPYQRTRYGVYAKIPNGDMTLEVVKTKYDAKIFDSYLEQIAKYGKDLGDEMKIYTATPIKTKPQPPKVDTRKW